MTAFTLNCRRVEEVEEMEEEKEEEEEDVVLWWGRLWCMAVQGGRLVLQKTSLQKNNKDVSCGIQTIECATERTEFQYRS